jgi:tRNA(adenine34) deaminase
VDIGIERSAPVRVRRGTPETDNSMEYSAALCGSLRSLCERVFQRRGRRDTQRAADPKSASLTLFQRAPYSGRSLESKFDEQWMRQALAAARDAQANGEVPVGVCIVSENKLVAVCGNRTRTDCDPTAHAEIVALREAASKLGNYRLTGVDVYSTIEPCAMCAGALIQARVRRLIYGAPDERAGAVTSRFRICDTDFLNHRIQISAGVLEAECRALMQEFFQTRRGRIVD